MTVFEEIAFVGRPERRAAYHPADVGPLLVLLPRMGDLRVPSRFLAEALWNAGARPVAPKFATTVIGPPRSHRALMPNARSEVVDEACHSEHRP